MNTFEQIKADRDELYNNIDECISQIVRARLSHDREAEGKALFWMETLMVQTQQFLAYLDKLPEEPNYDELVRKFKERVDNMPEEELEAKLDTFEAGPAQWECVHPDVLTGKLMCDGNCWACGWRHELGKPFSKKI